jgi:serine phosphatase RsbU (regulator of sigma subunit)
MAECIFLLKCLAEYLCNISTNWVDNSLGLMSDNITSLFNGTICLGTITLDLNDKLVFVTSSVVVILVVGLIGHLVYHYKFSVVTRKGRVLYEELKSENEELIVKNRDLTSSLRYAESIQGALFSSEQKLKALLPESFLFFKPRDIVSGDFLYVQRKGRDTVLAVVDCTGHGVPGSIVSIIAHEVISKVIERYFVSDPSLLLNMIHKEMSDLFSAKKGTSPMKEGMDIGLCIIDKDQKQIKFSGAYISLYKIEDGLIEEIKGARRSVGYEKGALRSRFEQHIINYKDSHTFYMSTDGYVDQFGGPHGKKFKYRRFRHLLMKLYRLSVDVQKEEFIRTFDEWICGYDQVDDVLAVGFKAVLNTEHPSDDSPESITAEKNISDNELNK